MSANYGSFCYLIISLENGKKIQWESDEGECAIFSVPIDARKILKKMHSVNDLLDFILDCYSADKKEARKFIDTYFTDLRDEILAIPDFEDVATISLAWGSYYVDDGVSPKKGCNGESLVYQPKDGKCSISHKPEEWFVEEMETLYGDLFDDEDEDDDEEDDWDEEDE